MGGSKSAVSQYSASLIYKMVDGKLCKPIMPEGSNERFFTRHMTDRLIPRRHIIGTNLTSK